MDLIAAANGGGIHAMHMAAAAAAKQIAEAGPLAAATAGGMGPASAGAAPPPGMLQHPQGRSPNLAGAGTMEGVMAGINPAALPRASDSSAAAGPDGMLGGAYGLLPGAAGTQGAVAARMGRALSAPHSINSASNQQQHQQALQDALGALLAGGAAKQLGLAPGALQKLAAAAAAGAGAGAPLHGHVMHGGAPGGTEPTALPPGVAAAAPASLPQPIPRNASVDGSGGEGAAGADSAASADGFLGLGEGGDRGGTGLSPNLLPLLKQIWDKTPTPLNAAAAAVADHRC